MSSTHSSGVFLTSSIGSRLVFAAGLGTPDINKHPNDTNGGFLVYFCADDICLENILNFPRCGQIQANYDSRCIQLRSGQRILYPIGPPHHAGCIYPSLPFFPPCPSQNTSRSRNSPSKLRHSMMGTTSTTVVARQISSKDTET